MPRNFHRTYRNARHRAAAQRRRITPFKVGLTLLFLIICCATGYFWGDKSASGTSSMPSPTAEWELAVHFLDVGQADSILAELPNGEIMLIDAGNNNDGKAVCAYLSALGISRIDYLIGTHPHEDHIGGLDDVIDTFSIGTIVLPRIADDMVPTTKTYTDVLDAIDRKGLSITSAQPQILVSETDIPLQIEILSDDAGEFSDLNDYSVVLKLTYGLRSFLFTGDAEQEAETLLLQSGGDLSADVLKVGHHGSSTSTSDALLAAVSPRYAVISCEAENEYGHPHAETLEKLDELGVSLYRTDLHQTVVARCDGDNILFQTGQPSCNGSFQ